jgi:hypothetical protein
MFVTALATQASAAPRITSVTPSTGPAAGGTSVTIKGSGFETCPICSPPLPPYVTFGGVAAQSSTLVDENTIVAVTPAMVALPVDVTVDQWNGATTMLNGFTFIDAAGYEPVLLPIFSAPVPGAFGSEFVTTILAANRTNGPISILGIDESCFITSPPSPGPFVPRVLPGEVGSTMPISPNCSQWPGRLLHVRPADYNSLSFNIRVHDTTRNASSHGTEIHVVRVNDFTQGPIVLPGIPTDPRFRVTLRVYAFSQGTVFVDNAGVTTPLTLQPGRDIFEPAFGQVTLSNRPNIDPLPATFTITVLPPPDIIGSPVVPLNYPYWAFITITNNETQEITTVTPDV